MAQKVVLIDDLDGSEGSETITYTVNGQEYEVDLSEKNAEKFYKVLEPYIEKSRPVDRQQLIASGPARQTKRRASGSQRDDIPEVRAWAEAQGMAVSSRGRIKKEILEAYDQAHS